MHILVLAPGSTGDVAPYTGLGQRLTADGHHVAIAANERFRSMIMAAGLEFRLLRGDPESGNTSEEGRRWHAAGSGPLGQARMVRVLQPLLVPLRVTVLVIPPERPRRGPGSKKAVAEKDLDNILIDVLSSLEDELKPHSEPWLLLPEVG